MLGKKKKVILLFQCTKTLEPLWRVSKGLVHSCEKLIFLLSVGGGVGSMYVHYICESVPTLPITFSLKGQRKPCWNMPLETTNLFTAVSQNPKGCIYLQTLPFPFCLSQCNMLWMLATAPSAGGRSRRWGGAEKLLEVPELSMSLSACVQPRLMFQWGQTRKDWEGSSPKEVVDLKE